MVKRDPKDVEKEPDTGDMYVKMPKKHKGQTTVIGSGKSHISPSEKRLQAQLRGEKKGLKDVGKNFFKIRNINSHQKFKQFALGDKKGDQHIIVTWDEIVTKTPDELQKKFEEEGFDTRADELGNQLKNAVIDKGKQKRGDADVLSSFIDVLAYRLQWTNDERERFTSHLHNEKRNPEGNIFPKLITTEFEDVAAKVFKRRPEDVNKKAGNYITQLFKEKVKDLERDELKLHIAGTNPELWETKYSKMSTPEIKEDLTRKYNFSFVGKSDATGKKNILVKSVLGEKVVEEKPFIQKTLNQSNRLSGFYKDLRGRKYQSKEHLEFELNKRKEQKEAQKLVKKSTSIQKVLNNFRKTQNISDSISDAKVLQIARDKPGTLAQVGQLMVQRGETNAGHASAAVSEIAGTPIRYKKKKDEKMSKIPKSQLETDFKKKIGEAIGMTPSNKALDYVVKKVASDEIVEMVATNKISAEDAIRSDELRIDAIDYWETKKRKPSKTFVEKWRGAGGAIDDVDTVKERIEAGKPGGKKTEGKKAFKSTTDSSKKDYVNREPWLSKDEAIEKGGRYEIKRRKGRLAKIAESSKGIRIISKSGREQRKKEKEKKKQYKMSKRYARYKDTVTSTEAQRLALPKKEGGYGFWQRQNWLPFTRARRAEKMRADEAYRQQQMAKDIEKEGWGRYQAKKATRRAEKLQRVAMSPWQTAFYKLSQRMKWILLGLFAICILFLPMGLFYVVGWAMAVALASLVQFIVWVFMSFWFLLAQAIVSILGAIGQAFLGIINALGGALTNATGSEYQPLNWQWIHEMQMFKQDANGNWVLITYRDETGAQQTLTWGALNLVPPSFMQLDKFMPTTFDTDTILAKIVPIFSDAFHWMYDPIAQRYTEWITSGAEWYHIGLVIGLPFIIILITIGLTYGIYRWKIKPRMY